MRKTRLCHGAISGYGTAGALPCLNTDVGRRRTQVRALHVHTYCDVLIERATARIAITYGALLIISEKPIN